MTGFAADAVLGTRIGQGQAATILAGLLGQTEWVVTGGAARGNRGVDLSIGLAAGGSEHRLVFVVEQPPPSMGMGVAWPVSPAVGFCHSAVLCQNRRCLAEPDARSSLGASSFGWPGQRGAVTACGAASEIAHVAWLRLVGGGLGKVRSLVVGKLDGHLRPVQRLSPRGGSVDDRQAEA
jgi:hypothetical protein